MVQPETGLLQQRVDHVGRRDAGPGVEPVLAERHAVRSESLSHRAEVGVLAVDQSAVPVEEQRFGVAGVEFGEQGGSAFLAWRGNGGALLADSGVRRQTMTGSVRAVSRLTFGTMQLGAGVGSVGVYEWPGRTFTSFRSNAFPSRLEDKHNAKP